MRQFVTFRYASLALAISMALVLACHASAEVTEKPKVVFAQEFRSIEKEGIALIEQSFPNHEALRALIVRYNESDQNSLYVANFSAIAGYIHSTLEPDLLNSTASENAALRKIKDLVRKHDELQLEYQKIYKKLPVFD